MVIPAESFEAGAVMRAVQEERCATAGDLHIARPHDVSPCASTLRHWGARRP